MISSSMKTQNGKLKEYYRNRQRRTPLSAARTRQWGANK